METDLLEKAILKTLYYHSIFNYPLNLHEIQKYLIGISNPRVQDLQNRLQKIPLYQNSGLYSIAPINLSEYLTRQNHSWKLINKAIIFSNILTKIPSIRLIGISGSVAALNAQKDNDIDLFVVVAQHSYWITRSIILAYFEFLHERIDINQPDTMNAGKFCINYVLTDNKNVLNQINHDLYTAMEIAHLKIIYNRNRTFQKFLQANSWIQSFLPNFWQSSLIKWSFSETMEANLSISPTGNQHPWIKNVRSKILDQYNRLLENNKLQN